MHFKRYFPVETSSCLDLTVLYEKSVTGPFTFLTSSEYCRKILIQCKLTFTVLLFGIKKVVKLITLEKVNVLSLTSMSKSLKN